MKIKLINYLIILFLTSFVFKLVVFGQEATSSPTVTKKVTATEENAIKDLKEKVANKVAEIRKKNSRAVAGRATKISTGSIKIKKNDNEDFEIKLDETLTKYYRILGAVQKEIKKEDLEENDYLIATGVINERVITANSVFVDQPFLVGSGKITEVDKENYNIKVVAADKTVYNLRIENTTKQQITNIKTLEIERAGFSKIIVGDSVHFVVEVKGDEKDNTYQADKILIVPQEYFIK